MRAWYGLKGLGVKFGCAVMKCAEMRRTLHTHQTLAGSFLVHSYCHAKSTDLLITLNKTVPFDLLRENDQGDKSRK